MSEAAAASAVTGGCQCGAVRYALHAPLEKASVFHCRMCQKAFGSYFAPLGTVATKDLEVTRGAISYFRSSDVVERGFCRDCGTPLTFHYIDSTRSISRWAPWTIRRRYRRSFSTASRVACRGSPISHRFPAALPRATVRASDMRPSRAPITSTRSRHGGMADPMKRSPASYFRHPGESRCRSFHTRLAARRWIPALAGMTAGVCALFR